VTNLWLRLAALLRNTQRPSRYLNHEWACTYKPEAAYRFCMVYPDTYELGQANQALRILCNAVNRQEGMAAERAFLPAHDFCDTMRAEGLPLFSLESCAPLAEFDAIGITISHELAATNILETLDLAGIELHSAKRTDAAPLVIGGGPCTFNPEPFWSFFDVFVIGEGEDVLGEVLQCHRTMKDAGAPRGEILHAIAQIAGCYVPALYRWCDEEEAQRCGSWIEPLGEGIPRVIEKRVFEGFATSSAWEPCIVPFAETVHDRLNVEILRGCSRGCRFCQAGMVSRPVRERSADNIVSAVVEGLAQTGYDEVSLTSLSSTDHSQIALVLERLNREYQDKGIRISIPSQRMDAFGVSMAGLVAGQKRGGLTFAPEAGTQRLRDAINKNVTEEDIFAAVDAAFSAGWRHCKLYFMIGLPDETDEDVAGIADLAERIYDRAKAALLPQMRGALKITVSCALFVPKPLTPFQWDGQISSEEALRRVNLVRSSLRSRAITVHWHDPATSLLEAFLSRGGRECADVIEQAWINGARFDAWTECFNKDAWDKGAASLGIDVACAAEHTYELNYVLPYTHISAGVTQDFLRAERNRAENGDVTCDCSCAACTDCGVCTDMNLKIELAEVRHA